MPARLEIALAPERLDEGEPEERACFGLFTIRAGEVCLTEGFDSYINGYRTGPLVSGYYAAEWFVWNWWRLCTEPRSGAPDWWRAHRMIAIGEGYIWPRITIFSDGLRTTLVSEESARPDARPFRYFGSKTVVLPTKEFEAALDSFVPQMLGRLREEHVPDTNLDRLWRDLIEERKDPEQRRLRRLEALLGREPDESQDSLVQEMVDDADDLGANAVEELAADRGQDRTGSGSIVTGRRIRDMAEVDGVKAAPRDAVRLAAFSGVSWGGDVPAWRVGAAAARALREQEGLGAASISDRRLAQMAGTLERVLEAPAALQQISFVLDERMESARIVLRSRWHAGRRFDLARLIGDRLIRGWGEPLHPATHGGTYRQKAQRSFAAELLAPFEAVDEMMHGDYSAEHQQEVADYFDVSVMTVNSLLKNHGRIERDSFDEEPDMAA